MRIQLDSEPMDPALLLGALRDAGYPVLAVSFSRWIAIDLDTHGPVDRGSRLDLELPADFILAAPEASTFADRTRALYSKVANLTPTR